MQHTALHISLLIGRGHLNASVKLYYASYTYQILLLER